MPELPEVESVRRLLAQRLQGARIRAALFAAPKILHGSDPAAFHLAVAGREIGEARRRGKYLILPLGRSAEDASGRDLILHLKMRGSLRIEPQAQTPEPYLCAELALEDDRALRFYDMWRWGLWTLVPAGASALPGLASLGPEPFDPAFTAACLEQNSRGKRTAIKPLLLSQKVVAGLGNIYCDECLHLARLHPARPAGSLSSEEVARLYAAILAILSAAVAQGGAYADALAARQENLDDFARIYEPRIYDRPGKPCPVCGQNLIKFFLQGRGTTLCPHCQPDAASLLCS